jgi:hypothetical protein
VESVSRAQDYRLNWHANNASKIFGNSITPSNSGHIPDDDELDNLNQNTDPERVINNNSNPSYLAGTLFCLLKTNIYIVLIVS